MTLAETLARLFPRGAPPRAAAVPPGLYAFQREADGAPVRIHLRAEPDGSGLLLVNAASIVRLTPSGVLMAKGLLDRTPEGEIVARLRSAFHGATDDDLRRDLARVRDLIEQLSRRDSGYPVLNVDDPSLDPRQARLLAPLRADVPLAPPERIVPLVDRLWQAGFPHVAFVAYRDANIEHLVRAVERAEDQGMVAGVRARGSELAREDALRRLALAGIDHVTLLFASRDERAHDALCGAGDCAAALAAFAGCLDLEVCPVAEVPLVQETADTLAETLAALHECRVANVSFFAVAAPDGEAPRGALSAGELPQIAAQIEELAQDLDMRFFWQPPVLRDPARPLADQVCEGPRCAGDVAVRVEPDGAVIPPRGPYRSAGNLLAQPWETIWSDEAFRRYRERVEAPTHCDTCPGLAICAADCPRDPAGWSAAPAPAKEPTDAA